MQNDWHWITSKAARKAFVCLALDLGIDRDTIMKWTGHRDYKSMKPYVDITNHHKKAAMKSFDNLPLDKLLKNKKTEEKKQSNKKKDDKKEDDKKDRK